MIINKYDGYFTTFIIKKQKSKTEKKKKHKSKFNLTF